MALDFNLIKNSAPSNNNSAAKADRPQAKFWLNIGYSMEVEAVENGKVVGKENRFISLPVGIPLDTMEPVSTKSNSEDYRNLQSARNSLHDQIMAAVANLPAGESKILNLQVEVRRVKEEVAPTPAAKNVYVVKLDL